MTVNLSLKKVPKDLVTSLKDRAKRNHRSLQGEILAVLERDLGRKKLTWDELHQRVKALGIKSDTNESAWMIREDRDSR